MLQAFPGDLRELAHPGQPVLTLRRRGAGREQHAPVRDRRGVLLLQRPDHALRRRRVEVEHHGLGRGLGERLLRAFDGGFGLGHRVGLHPGRALQQPQVLAGGGDESVGVGEQPDDLGPGRVVDGVGEEGRLPAERPPGLVPAEPTAVAAIRTVPPGDTRHRGPTGAPQPPGQGVDALRPPAQRRTRQVGPQRLRTVGGDDRGHGNGDRLMPGRPLRRLGEGPGPVPLASA